MADSTKHEQISVRTVISDLKSLFSLLRTQKITVAFAYVFLFLFVAFTLFLAFNSSSNSSSPWFTNIFTTTTNTNSTISSHGFFRSHFPSLFPHFFSNSSKHPYNFPSQPPQEPPIEALKPKQNTTLIPKTPVPDNLTVNSPENSASGGKNRTGYGEKRKSNSDEKSNLQSNGTNLGVAEKQERENLVESLMKCDIYDGEWVRDDSYPLYEPGSCSLIDGQFNCFLNGRIDSDYQKLNWKPRGCSLPRLNGSDMLELLRGKRLVFVGDSLNRNMWESLVCILRNSLKDQTKVYEEHRKHNFRSAKSYSFIFKEYNCTVEFFVSHFLVQEWEVPNETGKKKETLRLDLIGRSADNYKSADILIFNTGHWWTHEKTSTGKDYYQEGSHVYSSLNVIEAFRRALTTWARWVDANVNPMKTCFLQRGGQWNSGGQCDNETEPIKNVTYLSPYPPKMKILESVLKGMKTHVSYLNITRLTDFRKDGHPSIYRKRNLPEKERRSQLRFEDCSHWCLPGVPDAWNELLYAELLVKQNKMQQHQKNDLKGK